MDAEIPVFGYVREPLIDNGAGDKGLPNQDGVTAVLNEIPKQLHGSKDCYAHYVPSQSNPPRLREQVQEVSSVGKLVKQVSSIGQAPPSSDQAQVKLSRAPSSSVELSRAQSSSVKLRRAQSSSVKLLS
ncbi:uncharacterized protein BBA_07666 [Beauveria bassiana ARSEF 2860]|uniref:Uncharacterized protein n=1 Tax=Beauveria bassiana (strain ARSEF 2860) TaxID=655819 RepID=J4VYT5_BEAB2|nr:uncharacterized protein BBA_07666 [Beauveria bassiana ARSEF 2860]EJP63490.1 hypothetical protein BBA_07666 [Beauveria bassiana ARSEF 2860]